MTEVELCQEHVARGWRGEPKCGKPVKRNGYCGTHANMHEKHDAERHHREVKDAARKLNRERAEALTEVLGISITSSYSDYSRVTIATADLEALVERLGVDT